MVCANEFQKRIRTFPVGLGCLYLIQAAPDRRGATASTVMLKVGLPSSNLFYTVDVRSKDKYTVTFARSRHWYLVGFWLYASLCKLFS